MRLSASDVFRIHLNSAYDIVVAYDLPRWVESSDPDPMQPLNATSIKMGRPTMAQALSQWLTAIAFIESRFDPNAHAPKPHTAKGLMQINNITKTEAERLAKLPTAPMEKMYDPSYSSLLALHIFAWRYRRCGFNLEAAVVAYNQGNCSASAARRAAGYVRKWKQAMREIAPVTNGMRAGLVIERVPVYY